MPEGDLNFIINNDGIFWKIIRENNEYLVEDKVENQLDYLSNNFFKSIINNNSSTQKLFDIVDNIINKYN